MDRLLEKRLFTKISEAIFSVPVHIKIAGIIMLPVLILGFTLNYWITTGLSDWLSYILTDQRVDAAMRAGSRSVIFVTFLAALASIFFAIILTYLLTRPLLDLHKTAQDISNGKLEARARVWANDEIGQVARSFNEMIDRILANRAKLARANQRLEAINHVAMAAGRELSMREVLESVLQGILEVTGLTRGWVYLTEDDTGRFYLAHARNMPPDFILCLKSNPGDDPCSCQTALLSGELSLQGPLPTSCRRLENNCAESDGFTHLSYPLQARGQVLGVINLLVENGFTPNDEDLDLAAAISAQASEIVANAWLHARLVEKEAARRILLESLVLTQEDERRRLALELHDGAGQTLTTLLVRLKTLEKKIPQGELYGEISSLQAQVAGSIEQVRELSYRLRPATLEEFGLARALQNLAEEMVTGTDLELHMNLNGDYTLPAAVEIALYRIAQESLTNILRHSKAKRVEIELQKTPLGVCLRIDDDGEGFDPDQIPHHAGQTHLGLISIRERAEMLGGSLMVYSAQGSGTSIQVRIPIVESGEVK